MVDTSSSAGPYEPGWPSPCDPEHRIDEATTVSVRRVVHGTDNSIGGTSAYRYGMDVIIVVTCHACRVPTPLRRDGLPSTVLPGSHRIRYRREDPGEWWRLCREMAALHRAARHPR